MTRTQVTLLLLVVYGVTALAITGWAHRRTHLPRDYLVADRRAGATLLGFSQALNVLPAWAMLIVSGSAFTWGLSAVWLAGAFLLAGVLHMAYIAPQVRKLGASQHSVSLIHLLSFDTGERMQANISRLAAFLMTMTTLALIAIQLQVVREIIGLTTSPDLVNVIAMGVFLLIVATAGWWALAAMETVHAILLLAVCLLTPLVAFAALESWDAVVSGVQTLPQRFREWDGGRKSVVAIAFIAGTLSFLWIPLGQPAIVSRALAAREGVQVRTAAIVLLWLTLMLCALLMIGWLGRVLYDGLARPSHVLFEIHARLLHPAISAVIGLIVIGALLTNIASQLAVLATALTSDVRPGREPPANEWSRASAVLLVIAVLVLAYFVPPLSTRNLIFCWTALAAALAPLLVVRLGGKRVRGGSILGAMSSGFMLVCVFHVIPDAPGDFLERVLPFVVALGIALSGGERRRNPDRADRNDETVHDRLPI